MATVRETEKALHLSSTEIERSSWGSYDYRIVKNKGGGTTPTWEGKRPHKQELLEERGSSTYHLNNKPAIGNIVA